MKKLSKAKQKVLDLFETSTQEWSYRQFEDALRKEMGARYTYRIPKEVIKEACEIEMWPNTVKRYIESLKDEVGNIPVELEECLIKIYSNS